LLWFSRTHALACASGLPAAGFTTKYVTWDFAPKNDFSRKAIRCGDDTVRSPGSAARLAFVFDFPVGPALVRAVERSELEPPQAVAARTAMPRIAR
jgi:hypothetical protein